MKKKIWIPVMLIMLLNVSMHADTNQTITVSGEAVDGFITSITFDGDDVTLLFEGGETMTADMEEVTIGLTYDDDSDTGISTISNSAPGGTLRVYNLLGQAVRASTQTPEAPGTQDLPKGIYIINGKKVTVR